MKPKNRRWRYLVDWNLQGSLCAHGLLYGALVLVAVCFGMFAPLLWDLGSPDPDKQIEEQAIVMLYLHERFWLLASMCLVVVVLGAVRFSHRIAGPLVRYKRNLRLLADGKLPPPLRTRGADYLNEEVACLNGAVAGISERLDAIRRAQVDVRRRVTALLDRSADRPQKEVAALEQACDELERTVRAFRHFDPCDDGVSAYPLPSHPELAEVGSN